MDPGKGHYGAPVDAENKITKHTQSSGDIY